MSPFPTPDPSIALDGWQSYTVAVREWQGDVLLLGLFVLVTIGFLALFSLGALLIPGAVRR